MYSLNCCFKIKSTFNWFSCNMHVFNIISELPVTRVWKYMEIYLHMLVPWLHHLTMLWYRHMVTGSKQTHQSMNWMTPLVMYYLLCVLPMGKTWHFSGKFDQHLSLYCGSVKPKFKTGQGYWFLWESCELRFPKSTDNFCTFSSNVHLKAVPIFTPFK